MLKLASRRSRFGEMATFQSTNDAGLNLFFPTSVAGLKIWFSADSITGLANADTVATWPDMSGNGNNAVQANSSLRPTFRTGVFNGLPVVRFGGTGGNLVAPVPTTSLQYTMLLVCTLSNTSGGYNGGLSSYNGTSGNGYGFNVLTSNAQGYHGGVAVGSTATPLNTTALNVYALRRSGGTTTMFMNGVSQGTYSSTPLTPTTGFYVGAADLAYRFLGDIAETMLYDNAISLGELTSITGSLKTKWGIL